MATKTINFNISKLVLKNADGEIVNLAEVWDLNRTNYGDVLQNGSPISLIEIKQEGKFIFGTLAHTQMSDLDPVMDSKTKKIIGEIPLEDTQGLGHFTSFLYDKELSMIVYESRQMGVTLSSFCKFFEKNYQTAPIETEFVLDPQELAKLDKLTLIRKFSVKIAKVENGSIFHNKKSSFERIIKSADNTNTNTLEYTITADRGEGLTLNKVKQMTKDLFQYKGSDEVKKLEITGKETEEQAAEVINFVTNQVRVSIKVARERFSQSFTLKEKYALVEDEYMKSRPHLLLAYKLKKVQK